MEFVPVLFTLEESQQASDDWNFNCGPAALCAVLGMTPAELRPHLCDFEAKGYTNPTLMFAVLENLKIEYRRKYWSDLPPIPALDPYPKAVTPGLTEAQISGARRVAKFLRRWGVKFEGEFASVGDFIIIDIGMRMLTPRELFRAQGFQEQYVIDRAWLINPKTGELREVRLSKESQIRMCGNSVCPDVAAALVGANVPEMAVWSPRERAHYNSMRRSYALN